MTREEVKSCICTIKMLQKLAYNIHGVMDVVDADNCKKIIKALEQEPCEDCVSREQLNKLYNEYRPSLATRVCEFGEKLKELPPVKPATVWHRVETRPLTDEEKDELIKCMQDCAPMNWTDTDFELGEESQYKSDMEVIESCAEVNAIPIPPRATNKDVFEAIFRYEPATDAVVCNKEDWCGASNPCDYCISNPNNIGREEEWWNAPYRKE